MIANVLLTIHQCECHSHYYMTHVMLAAQRLAIVQMESTKPYMVFGFKQKFLANRFCEGGDSYYGKKGCYSGELGCT